MPDPVDVALNSAALWGGAPPLGDPKGLASLAQYAGERQKAEAQVTAAQIAARAHLEGAQAAAGGHERGMTGAANISAAARANELAKQQETSLANAATARYAHEEGINLSTAARNPRPVQTGTSGYKETALGILGVKDEKDMTPAQKQLYGQYKDRPAALSNAWETHNWWETHGAPENVGGFIEHAKAQGRTFSPEKEATFRAQAGARDPEVRAIYGPAMEEYSKGKTVMSDIVESLKGGARIGPPMVDEYNKQMSQQY